MKNKVFKVNAILGEKGYKHFGIRDMTASIYGVNKEDIVELELKISTDQSLPEKNNGSSDADYWAWIETDKKDLFLIWPQRFLLDMCFPYGMDVLEKAGEGKSYRLEIISH